MASALLGNEFPTFGNGSKAVSAANTTICILPWSGCALCVHLNDFTMDAQFYAPIEMFVLNFNCALPIDKHLFGRRLLEWCVYLMNLLNHLFVVAFFLVSFNAELFCSYLFCYVGCYGGYS